MLHFAAVTRIRLDTEGRTYYRRKLAAGKKPMEAMRCLKQPISDVVYRQLVADAQRPELDISLEVPGTGTGGYCGATQQSSAVDLPPHIDTSTQPLPGPAKPTLQPTAPTRKSPPAEEDPSADVLTTEESRMMRCPGGEGSPLVDAGHPSVAATL